ncbi:MAG TPA: hypothetical protein PLK85_04340 [Alphaproteobacteria bacterium]|nr:hypothetical protein [Alphaproteobacteria bacterium]
MDKLKQYKRLISGGFVVSFVLAIVFMVFIREEKLSAPNENNNYLEKFTSFDQKTEIQTNYHGHGIDHSFTTVVKANEEILFNHDNLQFVEPYIVTYKIKNNDERYIDIEVVNTNQNVKVALSGLEKSTLVVLKNPDTPMNIRPITADWAGRLELSMAKQTNSSNYCIEIQNDMTHKTICHNGRGQVTL